MGEKMEATGWWVWGLVLTLLTVVLFMGVRWVMAPAEKMVERKVLLESHQYKESKNQRIWTMEAQLAEIDATIAREDDEDVISNLEIQRSAISVQLSAARRMGQR